MKTLIIAIAALGLMGAAPELARHHYRHTRAQPTAQTCFSPAGSMVSYCSDEWVLFDTSAPTFSKVTHVIEGSSCVSAADKRDAYQGAAMLALLAQDDAQQMWLSQRNAPLVAYYQARSKDELAQAQAMMRITQATATCL